LNVHSAKLSSLIAIVVGITEPFSDLQADV
jgi:hypothetical protein